MIVALVGCLAIVGGTPAAAYGPNDPPNVVGYSVADAEKIIQEKWQPSGSEKIRFITKPQLPAGLDPSQAFVTWQEVHSYGGQSSPPLIQFDISARVPDLSGLNRDGAAAALAAAGLALDPRSVDAMGDALVGGQTPDAEALVPFGTRVSVVPLTLVMVPDVTRLNRDQTKSVLAQAGLMMAVVEMSGEGSPEVVEQDPAPGTQVARGSTVRVRLGGPPKLVLVPDLTGQDEQAAAAALRSVGLVLRPLPPDGAAARRVTRQDVKPGAMVAQGTVITVSFDAPAPLWGLWPLVLAALLLFGALLTWRMARRRSRRHRPKPDGPVRLETHMDRVGRVSVQTIAGHTTTLQTESHPDSGV